jgi:replicative DNA helicase
VSGEQAARPDQAPEQLPQNIEAEAALLGALMIDNRLMERITFKLAPEHFFEPLHGRIFSALQRECSLNRTANPVTLKPYFDGRRFDEGSRRACLSRAAHRLRRGAVGAKDFAEQILALAQLRAMIGVGREIAARGRHERRSQFRRSRRLRRRPDRRSVARICGRHGGMHHWRSGGSGDEGR